MNNKEVLSEEQYQKTSKKLGKIGLPLLIFGFVAFISAIPISMATSPMIGGLLGFIGVPCIGIGAFMFTSSKQRAMMAYYTQSQMPIAQEGLEKMAPTIGKVGKEMAETVAPAYGTVAKEVTKGIKEGLQEDTNKEETK